MHLSRQALGMLIAPLCQQQQLALNLNRLLLPLQVWCQACCSKEVAQKVAGCLCWIVQAGG